METHPRMLIESDRLLLPSDETTVWRYLSFDKFVRLLQTGAIFFAPLGRMADPYEAVFPPAIRQNMLKQIVADGRRLGLLDNLSEDELRRYAQEHYVVSCWHCNSVDS